MIANISVSAIHEPTVETNQLLHAFPESPFRRSSSKEILVFRASLMSTLLYPFSKILLSSQMYTYLYAACPSYNPDLAKPLAF